MGNPSKTAKAAAAAAKKKTEIPPAEETKPVENPTASDVSESTVVQHNESETPNVNFDESSKLTEANEVMDPTVASEAESNAGTGLTNTIESSQSTKLDENENSDEPTVALDPISCPSSEEFSEGGTTHSSMTDTTSTTMDTTSSNKEEANQKISDSSDSTAVEDLLQGDLEDLVEAILSMQVTEVDPVAQQLSTIVALQDQIGGTSEEVTADSRIKGGEKPFATPKPVTTSTSSVGARGKEVWLMLNSIPGCEPFEGPMNLSNAYDRALSIVNDLKLKGTVLKRDGERGLDRFWHNGPMRIFYATVDPKANEVEAPAPIRPLNPERTPKPEKVKEAKETAVKTEITKSAKELLAEQAAAKKKAQEAAKAEAEASLEEVAAELGTDPDQPAWS